MKTTDQDAQPSEEDLVGRTTRARPSTQASPEQSEAQPAKGVPRIEASWRQRLQDEFGKAYMQDLRSFLQHEKRLGKQIFPPGEQMFAAFELTPFDRVKVVILGQDPYHGPGQAHGLSFSVRQGVRHPPSLQNIFKELNSDLGQAIPESGDLSKWARQGVLMLNATLSVEKGQAGSHQQRGWEVFTDQVISTLSSERSDLVFVLWGKFAQSKTPLIDSSKHLILKSAHPSPFSARRGFFGSRPFSQINRHLEARQIEPIDWSLPNR